jgi:hypothetical protein
MVNVTVTVFLIMIVTVTVKWSMLYALYTWWFISRSQGPLVAGVEVNECEQVCIQVCDCVIHTVCVCVYVCMYVCTHTRVFAFVCVCVLN